MRRIGALGLEKLCVLVEDVLFQARIHLEVMEPVHGGELLALPLPAVLNRLYVSPYGPTADSCLEGNLADGEAPHEPIYDGWPPLGASNLSGSVVPLLRHS